MSGAPAAERPSGAGLVAGLVSVIVPVHDRPILLREAVESVLGQTYQQFELLLVDDGSGRETAELCDALARADRRVAVLRPPPSHRPGLVREAGRLAARGEFLQYLDSDDLIDARKLERMTRALRENPDCDIAYCATRRYLRGEPPTDTAVERTGERFESLLPESLAGRPWHTCTPLYTRRITDRAGPWSSLPYWEDVEYDLRMAVLGARLAYCPEPLADFRDHHEPRLSDAGFFDRPDAMRHAPAAYRLLAAHAAKVGVGLDSPHLQAFLAELRRLAERCRALGLEDAWLELLATGERLSVELRARGEGTTVDQVLAGARRGYLDEVGHAAIRGWAARGNAGAPVAIYVNGRAAALAEPRVARPDVTAALGVEPRCGFACELPRPHVSGAFPRWLEDGDVVSARWLDGGELAGSPRVYRNERFDLGDLGLRPFTDDWGFSRGLPVDRHYIEAFLAREAGAIRGRVLEVGDRDYTGRFGGARVELSEVLDLVPHEGVTYVADLQDAAAVPSESFDCVILTQVLVLVPDPGAALATVHRLLRPGGTALVTNPGISQVSGESGEAATWHWSLYPLALRRLLVGAGFGADDLAIESWGNLKSTVAFLAGLAAGDLAPDELAARDPRYPLIVTARAVRSAARA